MLVGLSDLSHNLNDTFFNTKWRTLMDIIRLKQLLTELHTAGIQELILEPKDDGTMLKGSGTNNQILVYHFHDHQFSDKTIGIKDINVLLSRINLFDVDKASISLTTDNSGDVGDIVIKQGRKKVTYRTYLPKFIAAPQYVPDDVTITDDTAIKLDKDYCDYLQKAISSISMTGDKKEQSIRLSISDGTLKTHIHDGSDDAFTDEIEIDVIGDTTGLFDTQPFAKILKVSVSAESNDNKAVFALSSRGIGVFKTETINVLLHPAVN